MKRSIKGHRKYEKKKIITVSYNMTLQQCYIALFPPSTMYSRVSFRSAYICWFIYLTPFDELCHIITVIWFWYPGRTLNQLSWISNTCQHWTCHNTYQYLSFDESSLNDRWLGCISLYICVCSFMSDFIKYLCRCHVVV